MFVFCCVQHILNITWKSVYPFFIYCCSPLGSNKEVIPGSKGLKATSAKVPACSLLHIRSALEISWKSVHPVFFYKMLLTDTIFPEKLVPPLMIISRDPFIRFSVILLTDRQQTDHTDKGETYPLPFGAGKNTVNSVTVPCTCVGCH